MKRWVLTMWRRFKCRTFGHDTTCAAMEGIAPTAKQLEGIEGFREYARQWCKRCGEESTHREYQRLVTALEVLERKRMKEVI